MKKLLLALLAACAAITAPAQVNTYNILDKTTYVITGGTIDGTPIGGVTPAAGAFTTLSATGAITSTLATGTAPFTVASTTQVSNLNASQLVGATWAAPAAIGSGTPTTGAFTTLSATGAITSTLATGTAPFTVASTTQVTNLNASQLVGATWASPAAIGTGTPAAITGSAVTSTGLMTAANDINMSSGVGVVRSIAAGYLRLVGGPTAGTDPTLTMYSSGNGNAGLVTMDAATLRFRTAGASELARFAPTTGALLINMTTDDTVNKLQVTGGVKVTGTINGTTGMQVNGVALNPVLTGTTGAISAALSLGTCTSGTVAVTSSTTSMTVSVSPNTYPGDGYVWYGYVSANGTVTVKVCSMITGTPTSSTYNVRVIQ